MVHSKIFVHTTAKLTIFHGNQKSIANVDKNLPLYLSAAAILYPHVVLNQYVFAIILSYLFGYPICCLPFVFTDESYVHISELSRV
jgi:hypothetical protein